MELMDFRQEPQKPSSHFELVASLNHPEWSVKVRQQALMAMGSLEGWGSQYKATVLIDLILLMRPEVVVEIGVWGGKSLIPLAYSVKANGKGKVYGIDPWDPKESIVGMDEVNSAWWSSIDHQAVYSGLVQKIYQLGLQNHVDLIRMTSQAAPVISNIGFLHIDGNHSEELSFQDILKWVPEVKSGGIILLDDLGWTYNGVQTLAKAKNWLDANCLKLTEVNDEGNSWGLWIKK